MLVVTINLLELLLPVLCGLHHLADLSGGCDLGLVLLPGLVYLLLLGSFWL